jgi:hypothetical protein
MERNSKKQIHKKTLVYEFSEKYKSKKSVKAASEETQQNTKTKKLNCL